MNNKATSFNDQILGAAVVNGGVALGLAAIGYYPTLRLAETSGVYAMLLGILVSLVAGIAGCVPLCHALARAPAKIAITSQIGTAVRFLLVLLLVAPLMFGGWVAKAPFVVWVAMSYLILLLVDTLRGLAAIRGAREGPA